jgi:hypothetical protein
VVTFGAPDILDQVARSANAAMKAAWYHKWLVHRRLRPEEAGARIHHHLTGQAAYPLHPKLTGSAVLDRLYSAHGSYLCPQAYPEGCPTHPAYPGATATIGGAEIRVLKALFNPAFVIPDPVVPSDDGLSLRPWRGEPLTVGGELNKLAFNMACGRDTAGVHFRRDEVEGIMLAEGDYYSPPPATPRPPPATPPSRDTSAEATSSLASNCVRGGSWSVAEPSARALPASCNEESPDPSWSAARRQGCVGVRRRRNLA